MCTTSSLLYGSMSLTPWLGSHELICQLYIFLSDTHCRPVPLASYRVCEPLLWAINHRRLPSRVATSYPHYALSSSPHCFRLKSDELNGMESSIRRRMRVPSDHREPRDLSVRLRWGISPTSKRKSDELTNVESYSCTKLPGEGGHPRVSGETRPALPLLGYESQLSHVIPTACALFAQMCRAGTPLSLFDSEAYTHFPLTIGGGEGEQTSGES